ncbi:allatotropins-like [Galleria mellonella]|uniref:Allatotropins-like n=1 Tax=Galleria mellonella TaxID=7137 RepID=A0A6J1X137_GALME|nr:allatotropins-like [Galleria mellonella]
MNFSMQLAVVVAAACLCLAEGAPDGRLVRTKQQRPTRGFKNVEMMTARGFGKRDRPSTRTEHHVEHQSASDRTGRGIPTFKSPAVGIARDFGKRAPEKVAEDQYEFAAPARKKFNPKSSLMVASDFGKRSYVDDNSDEEYEIRVTRGVFKPNAKILIARGYGKRNELENHGVYGLDNFWETLEASPEREGQDGNEEKAVESIPLDWFVNEMLNNPDFARSVVRKFVDLNQDGQLSSEELLRNVV